MSMDLQCFPAAPADPVFGIANRCKEDKCPNKVDLVVGAYRDDSGKPVVFKSVSLAEQAIVDSKKNKEYLPITGDPQFNQLSQKMIFGVNDPNILSVQGLSGTGSLFVVGSYLFDHGCKDAKVLVSDPSWPIHRQQFTRLGFAVDTYPYWDALNNSVDFVAMRAKLESVEPSIVILHACAHNPTGQDLSHAQWEMIIETVKNKKHYCILDCAYQGFSSGSLENDAWVIRRMYSEKIAFCVTQSYAKNMGLYGERVGCVHMVLSSPEVVAATRSHISMICRSTYSNPPRHGSDIVCQILGDEKLTAQWDIDLKECSTRIRQVRERLASQLAVLAPKWTWTHLTDQIGMFAYTGLTAAECEELMSSYHVYLLKSGRISLPGLNSKNVDYTAQSIAAVVNKMRQ